MSFLPTANSHHEMRAIYYFAPRATTGAAVSTMMANTGIITLISMYMFLESKDTWYANINSLHRYCRDGSYYYKNPNESTYYNNGKGGAVYNPPPQAAPPDAGKTSNWGLWSPRASIHGSKVRGGEISGAPTNTVRALVTQVKNDK